MHHSTKVITTIFLAIHPLLVRSSTSGACYFPDGTLITNDSPCFPDREDSMCCGHGHSCMSNGLCRWPDSAMPKPLVYIRGSCTDKSWKSDACPHECQNQNPSSFNPVIGCPNDQYCCEADGLHPGSCCTKNAIFPLPAATTVTVIGASNWVSTVVGIPSGAQTDPAGVVTSTSTSISTSSSSLSASSSSSSLPTSSTSTGDTSSLSSLTPTSSSASSTSNSEPTTSMASSASETSPTLTATSNATLAASISLPAGVFLFIVSLGSTFY